MKAVLPNAETTLCLLLTRARTVLLSWCLTSGLRFSPLSWGQQRNISKHLGRLLSGDVRNLWILHQGSLGTHFGRNEEAESIASIMLSCCSLESSLQPGCEIRGLGTETRINPNTKQGFCYITTFHHCLHRAMWTPWQVTAVFIVLTQEFSLAFSEGKSNILLW